MKIKTVLLSAAFLAASIASASAAEFNINGTSTTLTHATSILSTFKTSTNVTLMTNASATAYAATSSHLNGNRQFGTASGSTLLYYKDKTSGATLNSAPTKSDSSEFGAGWSSL